MFPELDAILRVQSLDIRIAELEKEIAALPKHLAETERALDVHKRRLEADKAALSGNQRDRKRLEDDAKVQEQKISKLRGQMMEAKTNEQYHAFQHEITFCDKEIRKLEDKILELMGEAEALEANVRKAEAILKEKSVEVEREKEMVRRRTDEDRRFLTEAQAERAQLFPQLSSKTASVYERMRKKWHGVALADATEGRCGGCNIALRPQYYQDLKKSEQLITCESCGRILYYKPPVDLEREVCTS